VKNLNPPIKKEYSKPEVKKVPPPDGAVWKCEACNKDTFGIFKGGVLEVKYKERKMTVAGVVEVTCRRCRWVNKIDTRISGIKVNLVMSQDIERG
jgi:hypothetical protein